MIYRVWNDNQLFFSSQEVVHLIATTIDTSRDLFLVHVDDLVSNVVPCLVCTDLNVSLNELVIIIVLENLHISNNNTDHKRS